jgi:hypothetical protein
LLGLSLARDGEQEGGIGVSIVRIEGFDLLRCDNAADGRALGVLLRAGALEVHGFCDGVSVFEAGAGIEEDCANLRA